MFSVRIHSLDDPGSAPLRSSSDLIDDCVGDPQEAVGTSWSSKPNPKVQLLRGIVHLYRTLSPPLSTSSSSSSTTPQVSSESTLPPVRGTLILILAVPCHVSLEDLFQFCGSIDRSSIIQVIRNDAFEDRYSVLVKFDDQNSTDQFYLDANGWRFSAEGEVCHLLFINSVEFTDHMKIAGTPPSGSTELPTCPVCIERLDQDISGIIATTCDHSFQCSCISKWVNSSCSVCHFCQKHSDKPTCSICGTPENLWICVICGFVGCGRYEEGHGIRHWKDTQHCYSLDMETQRVWDYVGDNYVHRLNQSRSDNKLAKLNSNSRLSGKKCIHCGCSDDVGISEAILSSKVQMIVDEYEHLLASQLESQKQYYEAIVQKEKENKKKYIADAIEKAVSLKLQDMQHNIHDVTKEKKVAADINANLMKNQKLWQEKIKEIEERERTTLRIKDENIRDLEDQIRDYMVFIKAKEALKVAEADDIRGGTVLPVPLLQASSAKTKRSSKINRRQK
ncbi:BRAP2 RING ZnF UBP domain-containing protein 1-like [Zingiber officinale]|uniref:BRAP2 RING ZnF UBP domain-containing protein 1-like n=1 Tax=Zingiber officinale TaxID=94328 RepID=UPI001C4C9803|nr:BRAP2 RING ZnF UBP domain-containing protein 1-like [Zingiber officinale]